MAPAYDRDLVGYGPTPPNPKWPNGARLAVNFVMNYEEGSEPSVQDGEGHSESGLTEAHGLNQGVKGRDLAAETMFEYGSRVGFWRLMRLFQERRLPLTIFGCALAIERNPLAADAIRKAGFDVCSHGWRWIKHFELSRAVEREHIRKAVASFEKTLGERPLGWYCRYGPSVNTRELIVEEGGFLYDSDSYADELPYWVEVSSREHLVIPYTLDANDFKFLIPNGFVTAHQFHDYLMDSFDQLYEEGGRMMSVGLHCRIVGRPGRARALDRFLAYVTQSADVWVATREEIAPHWYEPQPPG